MLLLRRFLILPAIVGLVFAAASLAVATGSASAQTASGTVALTCTGAWPTSGSCTVTPNFDVPPGGSFTFTMPDGTTATVNCPSGCATGATYTLTPSMLTAYSTYSTPQTIIPGGVCVNGSYPTPLGCTSATVSFVPIAYTTPVYTPPVVYTQPFYTVSYIQFPFVFPFHHRFCHQFDNDNDTAPGTTSDNDWDNMTTMTNNWSC